MSRWSNFGQRDQVRRAARRALATLATLAIVLLTACGAGDRAGAHAWRGEVVEIDGVEVVRNPGAPIFAAAEVSATPLWRAPTEAEETARGVWERPARVRVADGRAFVLDQLAHRFYLIAAEDGRWTASFGRRGGGPGELDGVLGFAVMGSSVLVANAGRASLERFTVDGEYVGTVSLSGIALGFEPLEGRLLVSGIFGREGGHWLVDLDGEMEAFEWPARVEPLSDGYAECNRYSTANGVALRLACHHPSVQVVASDGTPLREIVIDRGPVVIERSVLDSAIAEMRSTMLDAGLPPPLVEAQAQELTERYQVDPRYRGVRADPRSGLLGVWEQTSEELGGGPATLHLVSEAGTYLARLEFASAWKGFDLHDARLYALVEDEATGLVALEAYELTLPEAPIR